jgi:Fe-S oxidoreductase
MSETAETQVADPGIDDAIAKLTPEKIQSVVQRVLTKEAAARLKIYLETCVHCALCAEACHTYLSRNKDPRFSPVGKIKQTVWELVKHDGKVSPESIRDMARIAFTECGTCRRCSMYCPFGIDISYLILLVRRICNLLGAVPLYLQDTTNSHAATMNQMWVNQDEWIDTLQWQEEDAQLELAATRIPLEKEGAEVMYSVIAPEPKILAQLLGNIAQVMTVAGIDWTMPATDGWDNSNMAMYSGDFEIMGRVERLHWETAARLKVKKIVMGECGHAFRGAVYDGPRWLGWKFPPIPMVHAIEFYYDLISSGRIKIKQKSTKHVTLQDPCNTVRGRGLGDKLRYVVDALCENFTEMSPRYEHNYCCAAGGGIINSGPPWKRSRMLSNKVKAEQMGATGAEIVITPCHNCHSGIEDIIGFYDLGMHTKFIIDILMETMEIPAELKGSSGE